MKKTFTLIRTDEDGYDYEVEVHFNFAIEPAEYMDGHRYMPEGLELFDVYVEGDPDFDLTIREEERLREHISAMLRKY